MSRELRDMAVHYAWQWVGHWYAWGGDDPSGFDCSGLVVEILQAVGKLPTTVDLSAAGLWEYFRGTRHQVPAPGRLVFYGTEQRVQHVAFAVSTTLAIGADGGGRFVKSIEDAIRHNAFVKLRPIHYRSDFLGCADPFEDERT